MQQADDADSTASAATSGGKFDNISAMFPLDAINVATGQAEHELSKIKILLSALADILEQGVADHGLPHRTPDWLTGRFRRARELLLLIELGVVSAEQALDGSGLLIGDYLVATRRAA